MSIVLDLIVAAIIILTVFISAKRGFVRVIIEVVGFIAAVFITLTISTPLSNITYDKIIEPPMVSAVTASVNNVAGDSAVQTVDSVWENIPVFFKNNMEKVGISKDSIDKALKENVSVGLEPAVKSASQQVIKPAVASVLKLIYMFVILIILIILVKLLAKLINGLFSFSVIGKANRILGGIAGIPKGIIIAMVFCLAVALIASFTENGFLIFTNEAMGKSWFFSHLTFNIQTI